MISTKKQQELYLLKWLILTGHTFQSAKIARNMNKLTVKNLLFPVNFDREKPFFLRVSILNFAREMLKKEPAQIDLFACAMRLTAALTYHLLKHTASHAETKWRLSNLQGITRTAF